MDKNFNVFNIMYYASYDVHRILIITGGSQKPFSFASWDFCEEYANQISSISHQWTE